MRAEARVFHMEPSNTIEQLYQGTGTFRLQERDLSVLKGLLVNNFMLGGQIMAYAKQCGTGFSRRNTLSKRIVRLYTNGLLDKARIQPREHSKAYVWSYRLSAFGLKVLAHGGDTLAESCQDWWTEPAYTKQGGRNNPWHQAATVDLLQTLSAYGEFTGHSVTWEGPRFAGQRFSGARAGGKNFSFYADAVIQIDAKHLMFLEHERSLDPDKIMGKFDEYKRYLQIEGWRGVYSATPYLFLSLNDVDDTQHHSKNPLKMALDKLNQAYLKNAFLIRESDWRAVHWDVYTMEHPKPTDIFTALERF